MTAGTTKVHADTDAQKLQTVERMIRAWNERDWNRVFDLFAEDGVLHSVMIEPVKGREAIRKHLQKLTPDIERIELKVRNMGIVNGAVFVERVDDFVFRGRHGAVPVVGVVEVENGRIREWREYYDRASLLQAMGLDGDHTDTAKH
ncbi:MAG TPA: nuclear transport factor 2 family protein [Steroidobacteraceae bacterium]|nr:nuclear transport factor 2 family protein [Steroidobacteraceae bacterium]